MLKTDCIDTVTLKKFQEAESIIHGDLNVKGDSFTVIADLSYVLTNLSNCNFRQPFLDISNFCDDTYAFDTIDNVANSKIHDCSVKEIMNNLQGSAFVALGKASNIWDALSYFPAESQAAYTE